MWFVQMGLMHGMGRECVEGRLFIEDTDDGDVVVVMRLEYTFFY